MEARLHGAGRDPQGRRGLGLGQLHAGSDRRRPAAPRRAAGRAPRGPPHASRRRAARPPARRRWSSPRHGTRARPGRACPPAVRAPGDGSGPRCRRPGGARAGTVRRPGTARARGRRGRSPPGPRPRRRTPSRGGGRPPGRRPPRASSPALRTPPRRRPGRAERGPPRRPAARAAHRAARRRQAPGDRPDSRECAAIRGRTSARVARPAATSATAPTNGRGAGLDGDRHGRDGGRGLHRRDDRRHRARRRHRRPRDGCACGRDRRGSLRGLRADRPLDDREADEVEGQVRRAAHPDLDGLTPLSGTATRTV